MSLGPTSSEWGCTGKVGFRSYEAVQQRLKRQRRFHKQGARGRVNPYRCRFCRLWHIGSEAL